ncbi:hypothetical protein Tco_0998940 [Tanacetum coccineum]
MSRRANPLRSGELGDHKDASKQGRSKRRHERMLCTLVHDTRESDMLKEEKLARKQEEEANIALIESWDNTQAMMEADF